MLRMDHVSVVVDDLEAATTFFLTLGMEVEGRAHLEGEWVERINALPGLRCEIVLMRTLDGSGKLEPTRFHAPEDVGDAAENARPNALGLRSVMFEVDDVDATVANLRRHGGKPIGEVVEYEDQYRLCYLRGPAGIIVALAQSLSGPSDGTA